MDSFISNLMAYTEWANAVFFNAWDKSPCHDNEEMRTRVGHFVGVQHAFLMMLGGETPGGPPGGPPPSFDDLKTRARMVHAGLRDFAANADTERLSQTIHVPWFPDPPCVVTTSDALVQVSMHTQHHRGQCMTRLKDFGGTPKNVDWIIWLWKSKPKAIWE